VKFGAGRLEEKRITRRKGVKKRGSLTPTERKDHHKSRVGYQRGIRRLCGGTDLL